MANNVEITVSAANKASPVFKQIEGDATGLTRKLSALGPALASVFAGIGVGAAVKGFINAADEADRVQAQLNATLRSTAGAAGISIETLNKMAGALQDTTTFSDEAVGGVQALLLTFTNIKANVFEEATQAALDMSQALGQDLKSSAIQLGKALQDPISGVTALRRVGVALTEDQQKLIKTLMASGDVLGAQKVILKELATEFSGSAAAATNTFSGKIAQLNNRLNDMQETVGRAIIDALLPSLDKLSAWFTAHRADIEQFATDAVRSIAKLAEDFGRGLGRIKDALEWIPNNEGAIVGTIAAIGIALAAIPVPPWLIALGAVTTLIGRIGTSESKGGIGNIMMRKLRDKAAENTFFGGDNVPATMGQGAFDPKKGIFNTIETYGKKLTDSMKETGYSFDAMGDQTKKLIDVFKEAGDTLRGALSKVDEAINGLFSRPSQEQLNLKARIADTESFLKGRPNAVRFGEGGPISAKTLERDKMLADQLDARHEAMRLELQRGRGDNPTEADIQRKFEELQKVIPPFTQSIKDNADALGVSLFPGFDSLRTIIVGPQGINAAFSSAGQAVWDFVNYLRRSVDPNADTLSAGGTMNNQGEWSAWGRP